MILSYVLQADLDASSWEQTVEVDGKTAQFFLEKLNANDLAVAAWVVEEEEEEEEEKQLKDQLEEVLLLVVVHGMYAALIKLEVQLLKPKI